MKSDDTDGLEELLRQADIAPPESPADFAEGVRRLARRRHRAHLVGGALTLAALVAISTGALWRSFASNPPRNGLPGRLAGEQPSPPDEAELAAELARIDAEIAVTANGIDRMIAAERARDQERLLARLRMLPDQQERIRYEMQRAPLIIVTNADRMREDKLLRPFALAAYRRAIELFPDTLGAEIARKRLAEMQKENGESS